VLVHARGNAAKNRLLWVPPTPTPAALSANGGSSGYQSQQQQVPPRGSAGVMPLDWSAPDAAEAVAAVREAMGGPLDFVLASDRCAPQGGWVERALRICNTLR
jgi:hypothetical protein